MHADTITVCWDGSGDYTTVQAGIDAAGKERTVYGMYAALSFDDGRTSPVRKLVTAGGPAREYDGGAGAQPAVFARATRALHVGWFF
ncbi:MAG: hypothetical protein ACYST6_06320 [Planctomycetota bacterium]